jgi:hypothetical protein
MPLIVPARRAALRIRIDADTASRVERDKATSGIPDKSLIGGRISSFLDQDH